MMMPKRVKWRKQQRGRIRGNATRGATVAFGEFGLQALEPGWIPSRTIEAGGITRQLDLAAGLQKFGGDAVRIDVAGFFQATIGGNARPRAPNAHPRARSAPGVRGFSWHGSR